MGKANAGTLTPLRCVKVQQWLPSFKVCTDKRLMAVVFKESEQNFIERLIPSDPSQFAASIRTLPKVEELIRSIILSSTT